MPDFALDSRGTKWGSATYGSGPVTVRWSFAQANYSGDGFQFDHILPLDFQAEVREALDRWSSVSRIIFVEDPDDTVNTFEHGLRLGMDFIDGAGGRIAEEQVRSGSLRA